MSTVIQTSRIETGIPVCHHLSLLFLAGIIKQDLQHETIELRLGQRIGAFILNRVFSREHGKNRRQLMSFAVDRHLPLFHCFQQSGLRLGRRAIDFVGQQYVGEDRALAQIELEVATLKTLVPVMSEGIRSGVN